MIRMMLQKMAAYPMDVTYATGGHNENLQEVHAHAESINSPYQPERSGVPLLCHICPKNSTFSDVSHLLTHISSKGHLSQYFNLSIARETDEQASFALQEFDAWFDTYGIGQLLRVRKAARAERGSQQQRRGQVLRNATPNRLTTQGGSRRARGHRGIIGSRGRYSQVNDSIEVKEEPGEGHRLCRSYGGPESPPFGSWESNLMTLIHQGDRSMIPQANFGDLGDEDDSSKYEGSEGTTFPSEYIMESTGMTEGDADSLTLKGVIYPGMGGFDAAREEQRRKRNQRKPDGVLQQLEVNSALVTTEEVVLDPALNYQRTRDVYDEPSVDGSEDDEHEEAVEKKPKRRGSQATSSTKKKAASSQRTTRTTRSATRASGATEASPNQPVALEKVAKSFAECSPPSQIQLPLHSHGFQGQESIYIGHMGMDNGGWTHLPWVTGNIPANIEQQRAVPTLPMIGEDDTLRPGNPNLSFTSTGLEMKKSSHFPGKENNHSTLKSAALASHPYLHSNDSIQGDTYNPLFIQPRDGLGFQMYPQYDDDVKPVTTGFQPINDHGEFNSIQMPVHHSSAYHSTQGGSGSFNL
ncbi:hypothetical protein GGS23DRAFT_615056 [Durotheca rogersii]|uniref:uncharacterized protein n=1 Tax=Durotheca rogersii TaxID=419775 RepID=UPI00221E7DF4|nr:uncharacterized protein GGS23DRAFT_615056 [Durotheca rogersii]KAI5866548.1 hypothetical protein GGS23DRAFT_615056 [Durotheca rogersii]